MTLHAVYLEVGPRRTFAGAIEWPGWARSGRTAEDALRALIEYGPRYGAVVARAGATDFVAASETSDLDVVERLEGTATTDFGAPDAAPSADQRPMDEAELARQQRLLGACWDAFDAALEAHASVELRKGPRGGGRDQAAIASHVASAEHAYLTALGARHRTGASGDANTETASLRHAVLEALRAAALGTQTSGDEIDEPRRRRKLWTPRYFVRRAAWHVLDHAWEIEDRARPA